MHLPSAINTGNAASLGIIQFAKAPVVGHVKTRLIEALGDAGACRLHQALTANMLNVLQLSALGFVELHSDDISHPAIKKMAAQHNVATKQQQGHNLGERMFTAIQQSLRYSSAVILVGSDCPAIDKGYLQQAAEAVLTNDLVIGPATDGGYVLIAMSHAYATLFDGIEWGTSQVLTQTLAAAAKLSLKVKLLHALSDIDRAEDLSLLNRYKLNF